jgi:DNA gyrase subunit A
MPDFAKEVLPVNIEEELKQSYLDYAMSVIVGRALPDVRDGLKPVHRRVLFAMSEAGNDWNRPYKKSARVVGDVMGKYHPHGDAAIYDTIVRLAQPFSMRYVLVDGQGNFGSVDGDAPAAMRYTEVRMARITQELLADLDKETVDFTPNYDGSEQEPSVLPTRLPNLLVNGSAGIAVGMATNIPPHNLSEVLDACLAYIEDPLIGVEALLRLVPGPDFPTGAFINGADGIREAYATGRGRIYVRAKSHVETDESTGRQQIVVTELPYQVNKARLLTHIADLVRERKLEGITELRDESDKDGMRMVVELRRGEIAEVVLNNLYQHTQLQTVFGINMVALVDGQPRLLNLKQLIEAFVRHRREVVTRRSLYDLRKARERAHVLEGLTVALANIDPVIELIKTSSSPDEAKARLLARPWPPGAVVGMVERAGAELSRPEGLASNLGLGDEGYRLSEVQAQAILDLRLQRLTGLEQAKITAEYHEILGRIRALLAILESPDRLMAVIREELAGLREQFGDARRTQILDQHLALSLEDLISQEDVAVTLSHAGYAKSQPLDLYRAQRRGGKGRSATAMKEEDFLDKLFIANTHDTLLCFSSLGRVYWLKVYELPQAGPNARGKPIVNLLPLQDGERINALLPIKDFARGGFVLMATAAGVVKKTPLGEFSRPRASGIIACELFGDDRLVGVDLTDGQRDVMLFTSNGKMIRFAEQQVRSMGRSARGVRGVHLAPGARVIALIVPSEDRTVLLATQKGYGKRTPVTDFRSQGRGGQGIIAVQTSARNGPLVGAALVGEEDEIMLITDGGTLVRTRVREVPVLSRNTQGVKLISLSEGERLVGLAPVVEEGGEALSEGATVPTPS